MSNGVAKSGLRLTERDLVGIKCDFFQHFEEEELARLTQKRVFCKNIAPTGPQENADSSWVFGDFTQFAPTYYFTRQLVI
jgi:hypothetical protein